MDNWAYKVSIIVPVYNVEKWLTGCIESLLAQTMPRSEMEILLIDDGSPDGSGAICDAFATLHPGTVKVWHKENEGVGPTRNFGIRHAQGKYLMYLDSDDQLAPETVKACVEFFDEHYDEVDMVTYKDQPYLNGAKGELHYRYNYLTTSGIYDLNEYEFITQTRLNICVKNLGDQSPLFLIKEMQEDQEYNTRILLDKMKIGYVDKGEYRYNKDNDSSIMSLKFVSINLFEIAISWFEKFFSQYENDVPAYIQGLFVNDCAWKLTANQLFPYHYEEADFKNAIMRLKALWDRVDVETIQKHPNMDNFHRHFWLSMKENSNISVLTDERYVKLMSNGSEIYRRERMEIILTRCEVRNGVLDFIAYIKSPVYNYIEDDADIYIIENGDDLSRKRLPVHIAAESMYHCRTQTNRFFMFRYQNSIDDLKTIEIKVHLDGRAYDTDYWFMPSVAFSRKLKRFSFQSEIANIRYSNSVFYISKGMKNKQSDYTWLYSDAVHVKVDNGYYQFQHDFFKNDGISRYYVTSIQTSEWQEFFSEAQFPYIITRNSEQHKEVYLSCDKVLTAFVNSNDFLTSSPYHKEEEASLRDKIHHEVIYLQHGVLHAKYPQLYSLENNIAHKIVVSSQFEINNFVNNYHYSIADLIPSGMARYDHIDRKSMPKRKILLAPSWRAYFATRSAEGEWQVDNNRLISSNYFMGISDFLCSQELEAILSQYGFELDVKMHPIATKISNLFVEHSDNVHIVDKVSIEDYSVFLTDFSSFVFDFVYLKKPIIYFVPDYKEFRCGINAYRSLDLEFEDAFGKLATNAKDAVNILECILANECALDPLYRERMDGFFLHYDGRCRERIYNYLINNS